MRFFKVAAVLVFFLGIMSINGALTAYGFPINFNSIKNTIANNTTYSDGNQKMSYETNQNPQITVTSSGYTPNVIRVKKGIPVTITLVGKDAYSCASAFRIPSLGVAVNLKSANGVEKITFTPKEAGEIPFTCTMGMYTGVIKVL